MLQQKKFKSIFTIFAFLAALKQIFLWKYLFILFEKLAIKPMILYNN